MEEGYGCTLLGDLHKKGLGVKRDPDRARKYYGKACDFGSQQGCDAYRELLRNCSAL